MNWPVFVQSAGLLVTSNVFMTFAWYANLKKLNSESAWIAALCIMGAVYFIFR